MRALGRSNLAIIELTDIIKAQAPRLLHEVESEAVKLGCAV